ncbi:MAG TPA: uroporphyrinogen-III synthase, partial [Anaeromyxobacteraceae bacterium]|nr:uroporphyrinogen-III synthase [Anaeromyxobacteraceae bacterium]
APPGPAGTTATRTRAASPAQCRRQVSCVSPKRSVAAAVDGDLLARTCLAAIGPTTAEALRALGLGPAAQPERASGAALADAIAARLGPRSG